MQLSLPPNFRTQFRATKYYKDEWGKSTIKQERIQVIIEGLGLTRMGKLRINATGSEIHEELERLLGTQMK